MAKEYIEREAATAYAPLPKHLREYQTMNLDDAWEDGYDFAIRQLNSIPAADVRPVVRGRWKPFDLTWGHSIYACTVCEEAFDVPTRMGKPIYAYCPNCGAKMEVQDAT